MSEMTLEPNDALLGLDKWPIGYELDLDKEEWPDILAEWHSHPDEHGKDEPTRWIRVK